MNVSESSGMNVVHLTPDGQGAFGGCDAGCVSKYDLATGKCDAFFTVPQRIRALCLDDSTVWTVRLFLFWAAM
jgi:hypothetical protein